VTDRRFALAVVCTANRFRSPLAAALIRAEVAALPVDVTSFAASGRSGAAALRQAVERGAPLGVDLGSHVSTRLGAGELAGADLVLGFERTHVAHAVVDGGAPRERAFTLPEFVPLAEAVEVPPEGDPVSRARAVVAAAAAERHDRAGAGLAELADPAGGPERGYDEAAREVDHLSRRLVRVLFGAEGSSSAW
jgi:protein-tyrosine phosphatase